MQTRFLGALTLPHAPLGIQAAHLSSSGVQEIITQVTMESIVSLGLGGNSTHCEWEISLVGGEWMCASEDRKVKSATPSPLFS